MVCQQQMFDPHVVVVPSAGRPTAVPLWVPALRAGCLREGGDGEWSLWRGGVIDTCLSPHINLFCQRLGHVYTRGHTSTSHDQYFRLYMLQGHSIFFYFLIRCNARQKAGLSLTHKLTCSRLENYRFSTRGSCTPDVSVVIYRQTK